MVIIFSDHKSCSQAIWGFPFCQLQKPPCFLVTVIVTNFTEAIRCSASRKGLRHLGLQGLLSWVVCASCLSEALAAFEFLFWLSRRRPSPASLSLMAITSWILLCDLQLVMTAAEEELGSFCRREDNSAFCCLDRASHLEEQEAMGLFCFFSCQSLSASATRVAPKKSTGCLMDFFLGWSKSCSPDFKGGDGTLLSLSSVCINT